MIKNILMILTACFILGCTSTKIVQCDERADFEGFYSSNDVIIVNGNNIEIHEDERIAIFKETSLEMLIGLAAKDPKKPVKIIASEHFEKYYGFEDKISINGQDIKIDQYEKIFICKDSTLMRLLKLCKNFIKKEIRRFAYA